ncbi:hypothetical protein SAMN04488527_10474 [Aliiroseovarius crassostreae]|nr:hypothetical protein SAMN04488527_10474 [Aliiroseovarius crassostreae]
MRFWLHFLVGNIPGRAPDVLCKPRTFPGLFKMPYCFSSFEMRRGAVLPVRRAR